MAEPKELKAGDSCPNCGGELAVDPAQLPDAVVDRHSRNAANPNIAAVYARRVREKAEEHGVIHKCRSCAYQARLEAKAPAPAQQPKTEDTGAAGTV